MAMHSAVILAKENIELRAINSRRQRKQVNRQRFIARGGVLNAQNIT
jgi:hypothetical protein